MSPPSMSHDVLSVDEIEALLQESDESILEFRDSAGRSLLHYAAAFGWYQAIEILIDIGIKVDVRDDFGNTPLYYAVVGHVM